jgi:hypothetical protein
VVLHGGKSKGRCLKLTLCSWCYDEDNTTSAQQNALYSAQNDAVIQGVNISLREFTLTLGLLYCEKYGEKQ